MSNVNTQLKDNAEFRKRKLAIVKAHQLWLHEIIAAMAAQLPQETDGVSGELVTMMTELDECRAVADIVYHGLPDDAGADQS